MFQKVRDTIQLAQSHSSFEIVPNMLEKPYNKDGGGVWREDRDGWMECNKPGRHGVEVRDGGEWGNKVKGEEIVKRRDDMMETMNCRECLEILGRESDSTDAQHR